MMVLKNGPLYVAVSSVKQLATKDQLDHCFLTVVSYATTSIAVVRLKGLGCDLCEQEAQWVDRRSTTSSHVKVGHH